ncbi:ABC transporter substrate-binding protein [Rhodobacter sp. NTK016B]|uniref:ABC transporter substrate-binding protein n=1 Tax=Rhodobacter sp. NTK016B TaxID=2759676 RepID=UPI001A8E813B|nr:ABC transporter substrate-binding protein [Rhodobacter sp. NTK016B]MBN8292080.1 ABC transporter substrate-binding protein [Rhodobacter sp. NTK016B]
MNMNRRQMLASSAAALALGGSLRPARAAGVHADEIVIGAHLDLSGPAAAGMPALRNATELAIAQANAAGGIHGRQVRWIVEDNGGQPQLAVRAVQKLIRSDEVFALLNSFGSGTNAATMGLTTGSGTIAFAPWAASAVMHQIAGGDPHLFTTVQNYNTTTQRALERVIPEWGSQRVGVIYQEGPFGDLIRAGVNPALESLGMTVTEEAAYRPGDIDFSSQVARLRAADVDLIVAGTIIRETVGVMSEVKKLGWDDVNVLTAIPGRSTIVARLGGEDVEGLYGIGGWRLHGEDTTDEEAQAFITAYREAYDSVPDENAANAYSYANWFLNSLRAAGEDLNAESFIEGANATTHSDFMTYGEQHFENNHAMPEMISIDRVEGGNWVPQTEPF